MRWFPAYVGLGSNLDGPRARVEQAFGALAELTGTRLVLRSRLYGSKPFGPVVQPDFVNAVAGLLTTLDVEAFFNALRALEPQLGREPSRERWGPRAMDLDLLVYGEERRAGDRLTLPHPGIVERNFVLYPLLDIAPQLMIPGHGRVHELAARVPAAGLWLLPADTPALHHT
ncbi:MAG: 2-amino-4-hydroxy-6-hydroxymethyldihydropteridine diphosphokinase [Gammaproteobacteria bacterium]|nr:2-amino-4-hydroxy-6-hydroxymethyldihydropteridine diphosphokinase [Gammaproteobacteria bacterium]